MKKFSVYGSLSASVKLGTYEAETPQEALEKAEQDKNANWSPALCWQCAGEVELGDVYDTYAEEEE